jgi:hypothetical protein
LPAAYVYIPERQKKIIKLLTNAYINSVKFAAITTVFPILVQILISKSVPGTTELRLRIPLFSSVAFKKSTKKSFFFKVFLFTETRHLLYVKLLIVKDEKGHNDEDQMHF